MLNFSLTVDDKDYTQAIQDRFSSLTHTDKAGNESDSLELILDDRAPQLASPKRGLRLTLVLDGVSKGSYMHDATNFTGFPQKLGISAMAINVRGEFSTDRSRVFEGMTVADIVTQIAAEQQYQVAVDQYFKSVQLKWIAQENESDLKFLHRLAKQYDALFKATGQTLVFAKKGSEKAANLRQAFGQFTLSPNDNIKSFHLVEEDQSPFDAVHASWHNQSTGKAVRVEVGTGDKVKRLVDVYGTESEAKAAAEAVYNGSQRMAKTGRISLVGRGDLVAEAELTLKGWREPINGVYTITSVVNTVKDGHVTDIEFELAI
jgi:phage protein D